MLMTQNLRTWQKGAFAADLDLPLVPLQVAFSLSQINYRLFGGLITINAGGKRKASAIRDELYQHIIDLVNGEFSVPIAERTSNHRAATTYFTRNRERLSITTEPAGQRICLGNSTTYSIELIDMIWCHKCMLPIN